MQRWSAKITVSFQYLLSIALFSHVFLDCSLCYECDAWLGSSMACMGFRVYRPELKTISDQVSKLLIFSFASLFQLPREKFLQYENRQS